MAIDERSSSGPAFLDGNTIRIGDQKYDYVVEGKVVTDKKVLKRVVTLMNRHLDAQEVQAAAAQKEGFKIYKSSVTLLSTNEPLTFKETVGTKRGELSGAAVKGHYEEKVQAVKLRMEQKEELLKGFAALENDYANHEIQQALRNLLSKPNVTIHHPEIAERFGRSMTLLDVLQEPGNENAFEMIYEKLNVALLILESPKIKECEQKLLILILNNLQRNPATITTTREPTFDQTFSKGKADIPDNPFAAGPRRLDPEKFRTANRAYPNIMDKGKMREQKEVRQHNVNMGAVTCYDPTSNESMVVVNRSGRSDTPQRLLEVVEDALLNELGTKYQRGIKYLEALDSNGKPVLEFTHAIDSHLDLSRAKETATTENERESMLEIMRARDNWPDKGIEVKVMLDGVERTVILKRPIVRNQILSGLAAVKAPSIVPKFIQNFLNSKRDSIRLNFVSNQQLFQRYLAKNNLTPSPELEQASKNLAKKLKLGEGPIDFDTLKVMDISKKGTELFSSKEFVEYQKACAKFLLEEMRKSNDVMPFVLYSMLFQRKLPATGRIKNERIDQALKTWGEKKPDLVPPEEEALSASDMQIYTNLVIDYLNISKGNQCMSGKDRTSLAVAFATAQVKFRVEHGHDFIPDGGYRQDPNDLNSFRNYFGEALYTFGLDTALRSTGEWGLKLGDGIGNPVLLQYLPDAFVTNRDEGRPYSGELLEPAKIFGLTDRVWRKEAESHDKELALGGAQSLMGQEAIKLLQDFFQRELELPDLRGTIFSERFELMVPLSRLALDLKPSYSTETRIQLIRKEIQELENGRATGDERSRFSLAQLEYEVRKEGVSEGLRDLYQITLDKRKMQIQALKQLVSHYERKKAIKETLHAKYTHIAHITEIAAPPPTTPHARVNRLSHRHRETS